MKNLLLSLTLFLALQSSPTGLNFTPAPLILSGSTAQPSDGTNIYALGANIGCPVTATNTVTVNVVAIVALTPVAKTYSVRVVP